MKDINANARFGTSVDIIGRYMLVGAIYVNNGGYRRGAAYMYYRTGNVWSIQQKLFQILGLNSDDFGQRCIISPDQIIMLRLRRKARELMVKCIFKRSGTTWTQHSILVNQIQV